MILLSFALLSPAVVVQAAQQHQAAQANANPIRKVVTLLQTMAKKVTEEGEKADGLYQKFMCYCKNGRADLTKSISSAEARIPELKAKIKVSGAAGAQLKATLKEARADRAAAKATVKEAKAIREKEAAAFAAEKSDYDANIAAVRAAVATIEKGMAGSFLQTGGAKALRKLLLGKQEVIEVDRQELLSFLSGEQHAGYAPQSGEIVGILKQLGDTMAKGLADATAAEKEAIKTYGELMAAKTKELEALQAAIESALEKIGNLGVASVQLENDLAAAVEALDEDRKFLAELEKGCATKTADFECSKKTRGAELVALRDTITVLNDDDALELFKKTLPSASSSLMQVMVTSGALRARATTAIAAARRAGAAMRKTVY